ncbi:unnamed protein product [Moneuplotes crassus]|uniref:Uncharacterized protein n=1 Tax=Euplotes crassus TaxID=5936 RepID=A0AAD2D3V2_EUPCR|nr:unnamed protein product [Moneuplotes crassus]
MNFIQVENHYNQILKMESTMKSPFDTDSRRNSQAVKKPQNPSKKKLNSEKKVYKRKSRNPRHLRNENLRYLLTAVAKVKKDKNIFERKKPVYTNHIESGTMKTKIKKLQLKNTFSGSINWKKTDNNFEKFKAELGIKIKRKKSHPQICLYPQVVAVSIIFRLKIGVKRCKKRYPRR